MILSELETQITPTIIGKMLKEHFGYDLPTNRLTRKSASIILEKLCSYIDNFRQSKDYYYSESNRKYLSMLAASRLLNEYIMEVDPTPYHKGMATAVQHGVSTGANFVPHVAGSAIGAFIGGLKGQALHSEAGRVNVANIDIDKEMNEHFKEYKDPKTRKVISDYMSNLAKTGAAGQKLTPQQIEQQLVKLPGNPFKTVTDPATKTKMVKYFQKINNNASPLMAAANIFYTKPTQTMKDVASALENLGYSRKSIGVNIHAALAANDKLSNDFNGLFRAVQGFLAPGSKR